MEQSLSWGTVVLLVETPTYAPQPGVAEHSCVRDANHGTELGTDFMVQRSVYGPIVIGRDVWVGAGCRILKGATIPDGCVIGANSIVLEKSVLEPNCIYGGSPVRFLKRREAKE